MLITGIKPLTVSAMERADGALHSEELSALPIGNHTHAHIHTDADNDSISRCRKREKVPVFCLSFCACLPAWLSSGALCQSVNAGDSD